MPRRPRVFRPIAAAEALIGRRLTVSRAADAILARPAGGVSWSSWSLLLLLSSPPV
jgi:hypothetical protein